MRNALAGLAMAWFIAQAIGFGATTFGDEAAIAVTSGTRAICAGLALAAAAMVDWSAVRRFVTESRRI